MKVNICYCSSFHWNSSKFHLNCTYQSVFSVFLISSYWHAEESYFRRFNYQVAVIFFSEVIFNFQLQIIWGAFLIYFWSNNLISLTDSGIVEYIQNHRNVKKQKSSFEKSFGICLSDVLMNPLSLKVYFYMNERKVLREAFELIYLKRAAFLCMPANPRNLHCSLSPSSWLGW